MGWISWKKPWEKEWDTLMRREEAFLRRQEEEPDSLLHRKLKDVVPENLQDKLDLAFGKAFQLVFEKGTPIIEKTYGKDKQKDTYKIHEFTVELKKSRKNIKAFSRQAEISSMKNLIVSGVEGVGLGFLGIGIPDIPLFAGMILKSIYEIALSYGYSYHTEEERLFILKVIQGALGYGETLKIVNGDLDRIIMSDVVCVGEEREEIRKASEALSKELLYMKFLQGIPIIGGAGGLSDAICLKKITAYAVLKYQKRFLMKLKEK